MAGSVRNPPDAALQGYRILVVEDEMLLAMELRDLLEDRGCVVLGPVNTVARALALLDRERPDAAVLDLNLNGERSIPVAAALSARQIPFVVVTGYGKAASREPELQAAPRLEKPLHPAKLVRELAAVLQPG